MTAIRTVAALEEGVRRAEEARREGHWAAARSVYAALVRGRLSHRRESGEPALAADLVVMERLAELATLSGEGTAADALLRAMAVLSRQASDFYGAVYASARRAQLAVARGDLAGGRARLADAAAWIGPLEEIVFDEGGLEAWERLPSRWCESRGDRAVLLVELYLVLGRLLAAHGRYGDALTAFERGRRWSGPEAPPRARQGAVPLALGAAVAKLEGGDTVGAGADLAAVEAAVDGARHPGQRAVWLEARARLDLLTGALGSAVGRWEELVESCAAPGLERAGRGAQLNLAQVLILVNQVARARRLLSELARRPVDRLAARAELLLRLAEARVRSAGEGAEPTPALVELWRDGASRRRRAPPPPFDPLELPQAASYLTFFEDRTLAFQWRLAAGDQEGASEVLGRIHRVFDLTDSKLVHSRIAVLDALLDYYRGEPEVAAERLAVVAPAFEARRLWPEVWQIARAQAWCAARLGRPAEERRGHEERAAELLERLAASLDPSSQAIYLLNKWTSDEELMAGRIDELMAQRRRVRSGSPWLRPWRRLVLVRRLARLCDRVDRLRDDRAEATLGNAAPRRAASLATRLRWRSPRRRTLTYLVLPDRVAVIEEGWLELDLRVSPVSRIELRELVGAWHRELRGGGQESGWGSGTARDLAAPAGPTPPDRRERCAERLAAALQLDRIRRELPGWVRRLRIVPDDILHVTPFAPLVGERIATTLGFRSRVAGRPGRRRRGGSALLVAVIQAVGNAPELPGAGREVELVQARLPADTPATILVDGAATARQVAAGLAEASCAHLACHGRFDAHRPATSGLLLPASTSAGGEILSLRRLARLDLSRLRHATLSACWTADTIVMPGRHVISLPEALRQAGAWSVLASLWPVDDELGAAFMARYYEELRRRPAAEALLATQRECRAGRLAGADAELAAAPASWAGFVLHGEAGRL